MPVSSLPRLLPAGLALLLLACQATPVEWIDGAAIATNQPSPLAQSAYAPMDSSLRAGTPLSEFLLTQDLLREGGAMTLIAVHLDSMPEAGERVRSASAMPPMAHGTDSSTVGELGRDMVPRDDAQCGRSLRMASAPGRGTVAVWWSRRDRGRVALLAAWRDSTAAGPGAWQGPFAIDTLDQGPGDARADERGAAGCARPAAHVVLDSTNGFVHVAYTLTGPEGSGIFYAHQMSRNLPFEAPQAIVYGERLGRARVASAGDVVVVAYEDPNGGSRAGIGLAVSKGAGHGFDDRLVVSSSTLGGRDPYVAARGRAIVVGWSEFPGPDAEPVFRVRRARLR
jgi:hypothetical protein